MKVAGGLHDDPQGEESIVDRGRLLGGGFGDATADQRASELLGEAYPGRRVVTVEARPIFARGGGIHCITQQQPRVPRSG
ncbi:agmatine deiminase family protein [Mycolicibacterium fluoranthenivorans]|uniref:Agmatine deiminase family protein n=1 Tax=Mycolicibacterium fluoranthenivorans TaxID=258505 RepID=A0A7G8PNC2_9MYCO|nr:agmatine deiminase family protein [Mycolicibacterium fluoranthenivorans]